MKSRSPLIFLLTLIYVSTCYAQDIGEVEAVSRISSRNTFFFDAGLTLREPEKEVTNGITFELGYLRRFNKIFSAGPVFKYSNYYFDDYYFGDGVYGDVQEDYYDLAINNDPVLSAVSFGIALKAAAPTPERFPVTVFGYVSPSFVFSKTQDLEGSQYNWTYNFNTMEYDLSSTSSWTLAENKSTSLALQLGGGLEFFPARKFSAMLIMTRFIAFSMDHIDIAEFQEEYGDQSVMTEKWPYSSYTFQSWNLRFGILINLE